MAELDGFIERLPKAEVHVHSVGSASVTTVVELARLSRNAVNAPYLPDAARQQILAEIDDA